MRRPLREWAITVSRSVAGAGVVSAAMASVLDCGSDGSDVVEKIEEYWLEPTGVYRLVQIHTRRLTMENPIPLDVRFGELNLA